MYEGLDFSPYRVPLPEKRLAEISLMISRSMWQHKGKTSRLSTEEFARLIGITFNEYMAYIATLAQELEHPEGVESNSSSRLSGQRLGEIAFRLMRISLREHKPLSDLDIDGVLLELQASEDELHEFLEILGEGLPVEDTTESETSLPPSTEEHEILHIGTICPNCAMGQLIGVGFSKLQCPSCNEYFPVG